MYRKVLLLLFPFIMILISSCSNSDIAAEFDLLQDDYKTLLIDYDNQVEESRLLEENLNELSVDYDNSTAIISDLEGELSQLEQANLNLMNENKKLYDESNQEIWGLENEAYMSSKAAVFWEQGFRLNFQGEPSFVCDVESFADLRIGDTLSMAIDKYGRDFEVNFSDDGFEPIVAFEEVAFSINESNYCITELFLASDKYETHLGIKCGDNAIDSINRYSEVYKSNKDGSIHPEYPEWLFDLGDGYVIQFYLDTEELTESSIITRMNLRNFWHGEV